MASLTMTASFLGGAAITQRPSVSRRSLIVAKAASAVPEEAAKANGADNNASNGRRAVMFAAAAAAVSAATGMAVAGDGPKRGSAEAKKIYAPVCVTMPTARICHN